ncbi:MAG: TlpA disulfide reductase family protein, partial [Odoribacter sp.]
LLLLLAGFAQASDYQVKIQVKNLPETAKPTLLRIYNGSMFILDSLATRDGEWVTFHIPENTAPGSLRTILGIPMYGQQPVAFDFLYNRENIELSVDFNNTDTTIEVIRSKENTIYFQFKKADALFFRKLGLLEQVVVNYPDQDEFYKIAQEYYKKYQVQRDCFIDETYAAHQNTLAGKIIRNQKMPITETNMTAAERDSVFRADFLEKIDFTDTLLLNTDVYTDKVFRYIQMFMKREASPRENETNCIRALDQIVPRLDVNPVVQQHLLQFLIGGFETMKMEEVLAHISANYLQQCGGSSDIIKRRLEGYSRMAIGQKVPDFIVNDFNGNPVSLYNTISPYILVLFWHTDCGHCQVMMKELPLLAQQKMFSSHQVKMIGISIDEQKENWEKFSANYQLDWLNTHIEGGFENEVAGDYNLFATPSMFLLDDQYRIIAKPTTI